MTFSLCRTRNVRDAVLSLHRRGEGAARARRVRAMFVQVYAEADQVQDWRVSRSGRIATDQKAVRRRGPGRVVLGSKPQLATAKKTRALGLRALLAKTRALGSATATVRLIRSRMDEFAVETLEFDAVRELLARHTSFSAGRALALSLVPSPILEEAQRRQAATAEALRLPGLRPALHLGGVHDIRPLAERAEVGGSLAPEELLDVASTVRAARAWRRGLGPLADETPTLLELADAYLSDHPGLAEDIQEAIGESGDVLDAASPALGRIRAELRGAHDRLVTRLREIMSAPPFRDVVQDPVVTQRNGRYVIPIRAEARGQVPGIVHDQSASGATLFVEPLAVVDMANRWRTLILEEEREIERILRALSQEVGEQADAVNRSVEGLAQLDLIRAAAVLAEQQDATPPALGGLPQPAGQLVLRLVNARHPLLTGNVVPISVELGGDFDVLLIT